MLPKNMNNYYYHQLSCVDGMKDQLLQKFIKNSFTKDQG